MEKDKEVTIGHEGRLKVKKGIDKAADAVRPTLGAIGMSAMIEIPGLDPIEADDGKTILNHLKFKDRYEQLGLQKIRKAALRTSAQAGDGTASTTVLTQAFVNEAFKEIANDSSKIREVRERLELGLVETLKELNKVKREVKDEDIVRIATISSLDPEVAEMIASIIKDVGIHGVITVEKSSKLGYTKEVVKGAKFDKGYISQYFVNDFEADRVVLENPYIALIDRKLNTGSQIKKIMETVAKTGNKSILFISDDVDGTALASLTQSSKSVTMFDPATNTKRQGAFDLACVRNPYNATPARDFLLDIAALTGATVISEEAGMRVDDADVSLLGQADKVIVTKNSTIIIGGKSSEVLEPRIKSLQEQIESTTSEYQKGMLEDRLAQLTGGIGVIRVGAYTDTDYNKMKYKFDNAIAATQAALQEGIVMGGGISLIQIIPKITDPMFKNALATPFRQMAKNAGMDEYGWAFAPDEGLDFSSKEVVNMFDAGIIDPFKVIRLALESAVHIASTLIDKEVIIVVEEKEDKE